jgi:hypothetical protein
MRADYRMSGDFAAFTGAFRHQPMLVLCKQWDHEARKSLAQKPYWVKAFNGK